MGGAVFMSTGWPPFRYMIIKEKTAPLFKSGAVFQNGSRVEPFWLHFFFSEFILMCPYVHLVNIACSMSTLKYSTATHAISSLMQ